MRISGTEPSSVILSQTRYFKKLKIDAQKCQNKLKPKYIYIMFYSILFYIVIDEKLHTWLCWYLVTI